MGGDFWIGVGICMLFMVLVSYWRVNGGSFLVVFWFYDLVFWREVLNWGNWLWFGWGCLGVLLVGLEWGRLWGSWFLSGGWRSFFGFLGELGL